MQNSTNQINAQQLAGLNQFNINAADQIGGLMKGQFNATNAYNQQKAQSQSSLVGGGLSLLGGLGGLAFPGLGPGLGSAIGSFSSGLGQGMFGTVGSGGTSPYTAYGNGGSFLGTGGFNF